jgi:NTP pyrophosphatase (non-canonical NTP hydrolase)
MTNKSMKLIDYQKAAMSTAVFPVDRAFEYLTLGLVGEVGEVLAEINHPVNALDATLKELGDVLWYAVVLRHHVVGPYGEEYSMDNIPYTDGYSDPAIGMSTSAGLIANKAKKVIRDGKAFDPDWVDSMITKILSACKTIAEEYDASIEEIMQTNIDKLASRKERGMIQGSGDGR